MSETDYWIGSTVYALASIPIAVLLEPPVWLQIAIQLGCMLHLIRSAP
jgi:hypothetical protein